MHLLTRRDTEPRFPQGRRFRTEGRNCACALAGCLAWLALGPTDAIRGDEGFVPLFNGEDLQGWTRVNTPPSTWTVSEEGFLVCTGQPYGQIRTERMYQNFVLELEWRHLVPGGNSGVFVWADDITAVGSPFQRSIEIQVLEHAYGNTERYTTHGDIFPIQGATMTPINGRGGMRAFPEEERALPSPYWNHYRIECRDGEISLAVNGKVVTRGKDCVPRKGYICLESEGGVVHFRNVRIRELPDSPVAPEHVAVADRGFRCLYSGIDLEGWRGTEGWQPGTWNLRSAPGAEPLETEETFSGDLDFIVDVNPAPGVGAPGLRVLGAEVRLVPDLPGMEPPGKWSRIEASVRAGQLELRINGEPLGGSFETEATGPFVLLAVGEGEWANPYVREAQASAAANALEN